jgi:stage IV sporulation protein A
MGISLNEYDLYTDIRERCGGEIYIGVLGPVRTGKSTFIKRFMEELVLPFMEDDNERVRAVDELPQSAGGKTITTTEPKFIPSEAAKILLDKDIEVSVRLIDCVGYMVEGAAGHMEADTERMVKTPWFDEEIPFTQAAEVGTDKVMNEHSTIGLVVTTDGSIGELPRSSYLEAEEKTITAMKKTGKPFIVLLNSQKPYSEDAKRTSAEISEKYNVQSIPVNCEQLKKDDINNILENVLYEFPISSIEFYLPKWVEMLPDDNNVKADIITGIMNGMDSYTSVRDVINEPVKIDSGYIKKCKSDGINMYDGTVRVQIDMDEKYYYEMLTDMVGEQITDEYTLIRKLKEMSEMKQEYTKVLNAVNMVRAKGYGVVTPQKEEIILDKPEVIKHGNKYGVKIKATSPSIHLIRANIETEIAPIVGTKEQAEDLITYIEQADATENIWDTNIFGKTVEQLVNDGITSKVSAIGEESQLKLQDSMQKIVNDINGGMVCIII